MGRILYNDMAHCQVKMALYSKFADLLSICLIIMALILPARGDFAHGLQAAPQFLVGTKHSEAYVLDRVPTFKGSDFTAR
jgi:hypothetical protein